MKITRWLAGLSVILLLLAPSLALAAPAALGNPALDARTYLPGDFVHVVVEAPVDTSQITAIMPDGAPVTLIQERRTNVWRGIWQVPVDFKKGSYSASLTAVDVQGNVFTGQTDSFTVGELALITLVGKPSPEAAAAAPPKPAIREIITAEAPSAAANAAAAGQAELLSLIKRIVTPLTVEAVPALSQETKHQLIVSNLTAGKSAFRDERFSEAAAFSRIVLYLSPDNKEAGALLASSQKELTRLKDLQAAAARRNYLLLAAAVFGAAILLALLFVLLARSLPKGPAKEPLAKPLSPKEKQENWINRTGWKKNPFAADIVKQLFASGGSLNLDGLRNFIKTRIEEAGGSGTDPFTDSALDKVFDLSKGKPEDALKICDWAVTQAIRHDQFSITAEIVRQYESVGRKKILIADDEEIIRSSLDAILRKGGGYETDFAVDGEEAVNKAKANLYGLILLDIEMPRLNGYEALQRIRAASPDLPIIFVTSKGTPQQTLESLSQFNLNGYIEKPFTSEKVLDAVARAIKTAH
jgi:CheY-like chemotaxis protein